MATFPTSGWRGKIYFTLAIAIALVMIIADGVVAVPAGSVAVIFDQGRGVLSQAMSEGLHFKIPFWQKSILMSMRTQEYTMSITPSEGAVMGDDSIEARSRDGQVVRIDATILYHVEANDAPLVYQKLGREYDYRRIVIRPKAREVLRNAVAKFDAIDLVSDKRDEIAALMSQQLKAGYEQHKVTLEAVVLRNVSYSLEFAKAIEEKQIAFQKIKKAEYEKQEAEQLKQKKIIEAEADAEAIRLKAETLRNNPSVIQFEFVQKIAPGIKWGILPPGVTPILDLGEFTK